MQILSAELNTPRYKERVTGCAEDDRETTCGPRLFNYIVMELFLDLRNYPMDT